MTLCMVCYSAPATESCLLCGKRVCKGDYAGNGLCKGCARGKKIIGYFSNLEEGTGTTQTEAKREETQQPETAEPDKPTQNPAGSKKYIQ